MSTDYRFLLLVSAPCLCGTDQTPDLYWKPSISAAPFPSVQKHAEISPNLHHRQIPSYSAASSTIHLSFFLLEGMLEQIIPLIHTLPHSDMPFLSATQRGEVLGKMTKYSLLVDSLLHDTDHKQSVITEILFCLYSK